MKPNEPTTDLQTRVGRRLVELLGLDETRAPRTGRKYSPPRYETSYGTKTAKGLGAVVMRILAEETTMLEDEGR